VLIADDAAESLESEWDFMTDLEELKDAFKSGGVKSWRIMLERKCDEWKNIPLNVAVIGNSGVGKSSFINAIRCLTADDEGAADVGVTETTLEIRSYPHPDNPLLQFWDLPGVGTDEFPRSTYLADIDVDRYDFFLLMTADRFTENDTWLGNEFHKRQKKYYFVRTKIGADISNNKRAHPRTHNEEIVVKDIRESTEQHLRKNGCENVPVFLIDSYKLKKHEFEQLEYRLVEDFPKLKRSALVMSLRATSQRMIRLKVAELRSRMWMFAALSGAVAAVPVPLVSLGFDLKLVANEADVYHTQLGLDETSLKRYAKLMSCDYRQLQSAVNRHVHYKAAGVEATKKLVETLCETATSLLPSAVAEGSRFIPIIGSFIPAPISFAGTYCVLKLVLNRMESAALEVVTTAADRAANVEKSDSDSDDD